jgi:hypothetical protein
MAENLQAQLVEVAGEGARLAGKLATIADTPMPSPRVPRAPRLPKAAPITGDVGGEALASALEAELGYIFPADALTVRYVSPAVLVDYLPLRLKLTVRHQHALAGVGDEYSVEQSSGPRGMFRGKTGTPGEVVEYVVRFFKRLKAKPAEVVAAAPAGGKRRHAKRKAKVVAPKPKRASGTLAMQRARHKLRMRRLRAWM